MAGPARLKIEVIASTGKAQRELSAVGKAASGLSKIGSIGKVGFKAMAAGATAVAGATGAMVTSLAKTGIAYQSLEQSSRAAFKTLLGSEKAAGKMADSIRSFAFVPVPCALT